MAFINISLTAEQLEDGVKRVVADLVQQYKSFTAWVVTDTLRQEVGPQINIPHGSVRDLVHDLMLPFVAEGYYDLDSAWTAPVSGVTAKYYSPTDLWVIRNTTPQVQLNSSTPLQSGQLKVVIPNIRINSTLVRGISYTGNILLGDLTVKLELASYTYSDVPFELYLKFINADSKGSFYNSNIKGHFDSVKVVD
jgi:hypothetical protein